MTKPPPPSAASTAKVPILLVDDRAANLLALEAVLNSPAYHLVRATSGEAALRELAQRDFAVVLLDVQMPEMDGFETASKMRQSVKNGRVTPIIFVTGIDAAPARVLRAYEGGAVDFIQKPLEPDVLRAKVSVFAELHRVRERLITEHREALFEAMPQLGWVANADGGIGYYNQRWYEYTGATPQQMEGWGWQSVHDPELLPAVVERWRQAIASGEPFEMSFPLRRHDGVYRWFMTRATPLRDAQGRVTHWVGVNTDIDEQKRGDEARLRANEDERRRLHALFRNVPAIVNFVRGPELVFELAHPQTTTMLGRDLVGTPLLEATRGEAAQPFAARVRHVFESGAPFAVREEAARCDVDAGVTGGYWNRTYLPVRDRNGAIEGVMTFEQDVTETVAAKRALRALADLALALSDARTPDEVATVIVEQGMLVAEADTCSMYVLDEAGTTLRLLGHRGVAPAMIERTALITEATGPRIFAALRAGSATWAETSEDYAKVFPALAQMKVSGPRAQAFWSMPLVVEGKPVGLLGMGFYRARRFSADERSLVDTLGKQCAQALLRALRLQREEQVRAWLATTLRSIGDGVIATDTTGHVTFMNSVSETLTGWTEADARGRALEEVFAIFSEETRAPNESPVAKVLREGAVVGLANHTVLRSKNGKEIPIDDSAAPIRDSHGTLFGVVLVFRDVTPEKREHVRRDFLARAGAALASSLDYRATLATVAQSAVPQLADWCTIEILEPGAAAPQQVAVAHVDSSKVRWARELGERYPPNPDARTGAPQVIRSGKSELYPEIPAALLEAGARDADHLRIIRELKLESAMVVALRGRERTLGSMTFIYADSGRHYTEDDLAFAEEFARRAAMAIENARALKEAEESRAEERLLRREADIANRAKDEFLATVSHELRTPLNAILGWTTTLRARRPPPEIDRALAVVERNARRQTRLIEDVLDVSRIISGKLSLTLGPTNVGDVVDGAVEAVMPAAQAKSVRIEVDADPSLTITADSARLQQVVWNLLTNAVKFSPKGSVVSIGAHRRGSDVTISVVDAGEGIAPEFLPHVFEPFRQADASTTRRHGGLGLGLAIVKQLVTAHGGVVEATSEGPDRGAMFVVTIPARGAVTAVTDAPKTPATATPATMPEAATPPRLDGLTVLVVDDEEDTRLIVEQVLQDQGATVIGAASATEALEAFAMTKPDVIVSDIGMPGMDGYALLRKVRSLSPDRGGRTPALALTAYARKEDAQRAFAAGFQMHVAKPVEPPQLVTLVANLGGRTLD